MIGYISQDALFLTYLYPFFWVIDTCNQVSWNDPIIW